MIVVGGDSGMGRALAILYGSRGARVVVNADCKEVSQKTQAIDMVVYEILKNGGNAVPNYDSITSPGKIVQCAINNFGGIDVLVCDYGSADRFSHASEDWDETIEAGLYRVQRLVLECWPHFKRQRYGRIAIATCGDGILGNFGKPSYAASKMGIVGFCQSLAKLGRGDNIFCNAYVIGPTMLLTRREKPSYPDHGSDLYARFAPFLFFLTTEKCSETGSLFEIGPRNYLKIESGLVVPDLPEDFPHLVDPSDSNEDVGQAHRHEGLVVFLAGAETSVGLCIAEKLRERGASIVACKGTDFESRDSAFSRFSVSPAPMAGFGRLRRSSVSVLQKMKSVILETKDYPRSVQSVSTLKPEIALSQAISEHGKVDVLVNCCPLLNEPPNKNIGSKYWDLLFKHYISSAHALSKEAGPSMSGGNRGRIFHIIPASNQIGADVINMSLRGLTRASAVGNIGVTTIIGTESCSPMVCHRIASLVSSLSTHLDPFNGMTLEVGDEAIHQVEFKHTMGFRIPSVEDDELPEDIFKRWWQISESSMAESIPDQRRLSVLSSKLASKLKRMSLSG